MPRPRWRPTSTDRVLTEITDWLRRSRAVRTIEIDEGWSDDRDVSIPVGRWAWLDVRGLAEDHGGGKTLVRLSTMVEGADVAPSKKVFVIVVSVGHRKYGLVVDRLAGEQELVIKALDDLLVSTELVSGASVLGDGRVVLILNISTVVERVGRHAKRAGVGV